MNDDPNEQLRRLAACADEEPEGTDLLDDPRWQELAEGRASEETIAELRRLAELADMPEAMEMFASKGLRPVAVAEMIGDKWHFMGMMSLFDPPRDDTKIVIEAAIRYGALGAPYPLYPPRRSTISKNMPLRLGRE